jgi:hypothetical protein
MNFHLHVPAALPPGKYSPELIVIEAGWVPELFWSREQSLAPAGNLTPAVQPVVRRYPGSRRVQKLMFKLFKDIFNDFPRSFRMQ